MRLKEISAEIVDRSTGGVRRQFVEDVREVGDGVVLKDVFECSISGAEWSRVMATNPEHAAVVFAAAHNLQRATVAELVVLVRYRGLQAAYRLVWSFAATVQEVANSFMSAQKTPPA